MRRGLNTLLFVLAMLLLLALVVFAARPAAAGTVPPSTSLDTLAEIPPAFRGAWCETSNPKILKRCRKPLDEGDIVLTATALKLGDTHCRQTKILASRNRKYVSLRASCGTETHPDDWQGGFQMWLVGRDRLEYRE